VLEFAVRVHGLHNDDEDKAAWVLAVDPVAGLLIVHEDKTMHWHPLADCSFAKLVLPDAPRPVVPVQLQRGPEVLVPNRATRREIERNGA